MYEYETCIFEFKQLNVTLTKNRTKSLNILFNYMQLGDFKQLAKYYQEPRVKELLTPLEKDYLDGLLLRYYGPEATESPPERKTTH